MHPPKQLLNLRRQLEEILAVVTTDHNGGAFAQCFDEIIVLPVNREDDQTGAEPDVALGRDDHEPETACEPAPAEVGQVDDLYDDALVVVTEFGQATPAILQMWLSITYSRAITILSRFEADGLISSKGKVRHKAFSSRRTLDQLTR